MKAIVFDVDWVIIISAEEKMRLIIKVLDKHNLYDVKWVKQILSLSLNRVVFIDRIHEIVSFDKAQVLSDIHDSLLALENNPIPNTPVIDFIKENHQNYVLFTNTSLPKDSLVRTLKNLWIIDCFKELFTWEDGYKLENLKHIISKYSVAPEDILFIDDTLGHIEDVKPSGVHLLHFDDLNIDITSRLKEY